MRPDRSLLHGQRMPAEELGNLAGADPAVQLWIEWGGSVEREQSSSSATRSRSSVISSWVVIASLDQLAFANL